MKESKFETLNQRLRELDQERDAVLDLLSIWRKDKQENSLHNRIIEAALELIKKEQKPVRNFELLSYIHRKGISLRQAKDRSKFIAAILGQEAKKSNARIKRVGWGLYDIKRQSGRVGRSQSYQHCNAGDAGE